MGGNRSLKNICNGALTTLHRRIAARGGPLRLARRAPRRPLITAPPAALRTRPLAHSPPTHCPRHARSHLAIQHGELSEIVHLAPRGGAPGRLRGERRRRSQETVHADRLHPGHNRHGAGREDHRGPPPVRGGDGLARLRAAERARRGQLRDDGGVRPAGGLHRRAPGLGLSKHTQVVQKRPGCDEEGVPQGGLVQNGAADSEDPGAGLPAGDGDQQLLLRAVQLVLHSEGSPAAGGDRRAAAARLQVVLVLQAEEVLVRIGDAAVSGPEPALPAQTAAEDQAVQVSPGGGELMARRGRPASLRRRTVWS